MDEKAFSIESIYSGPKAVLLQIRIQTPLFESLERQAQERNLPVSEVVRESLIFQLLPKDLARKVEAGVAIAESETVLDGLKEYYLDLSKMVDELEAVHRRAVSMQETIKLIEKKVAPVVKRVFEDKMKKWRLEEAKAEEKRRQQKAAGLRGPDKPLPHKLNEDKLTATQRRQIELAGIKNE